MEMKINEPIITKCPKCGGVADNGNDRCFPPNPYYCKNCTEIEALKAKSPKCQCTFSQKTAGDGCQVCNPQMAIDMLSEQVEELKAKLDKAKWQPIETAPRDGRPILVSITIPKSGDSWQDVVCFNDIENQFMSGLMFIGHDFITHWMPLPDAPEQR